MNFTLRQLEIYLKITKHKSITKAAEELYLSQPGVSLQLKKFQEQFDIPLTELIGRQLFITDFGKEIARSAQRILAEVDTIEYSTNAFQGKLSGQLKLSIVSTAKYVMPYFLSEFMNRHPGVDLVMDVTNKKRVISSLERNEVDFSMVSVVPAHLELDRVKLMPNRLYLIGGRFGPARKHPKTIQELSDNHLLFREPGSATREAMEAYLAEKKVTAFKKIELTSNEALKQAIIAGLGYSIMPIIGLKNELIAGDVELIPLPGLPIATEWDLVWLKAKRLSPVAEAYLEFVRQQKCEIVGQWFEWCKTY